MPNREYYVHILNSETKEVVEEMGPFSEWKAEKVEKGANINLNHEEYFTIILKKGKNENISNR